MNECNEYRNLVREFVEVNDVQYINYEFRMGDISRSNRFLMQTSPNGAIALAQKKVLKETICPTCNFKTCNLRPAMQAIGILDQARFY